MSTAPNLAAVEAVALDIDGCLALSDRPSGEGGIALPGASDILSWARRTGRPLAVMTNGSSQPPAVIAQHLRDVGLDVGEDEILTPAVVAGRVCHSRWPGDPILAFGGPGVVDVLTGAGVPLAHGVEDEPAAVLIGWDTEFHHEKLQLAADAVFGGAALLVTSDAKRFASRGRRLVGLSGFIASGLSFVTERSYEVVGKPANAAMDAILDRLGHPAATTLVVGDDLELELAMARRAGSTSVLVTTGVSTAADAATLPPEERPDLVLSGLDELLPLLAGADVSTPGTSRAGR